ncbi:uncharacterized protein BKA78DRAFT_51774 [Phyllosticta capitalensis]|uniref:uncharacterized protein n=1 Tax=Phyllosticta capitalensis TaxID=121624 RepID=UPI003131E0DD
MVRHFKAAQMPEFWTPCLRVDISLTTVVVSECYRLHLSTSKSITGAYLDSAYNSTHWLHLRTETLFKPVEHHVLWHSPAVRANTPTLPTTRSSPRHQSLPFDYSTAAAFFSAYLIDSCHRGPSTHRNLSQTSPLGEQSSYEGDTFARTFDPHDWPKQTSHNAVFPLPACLVQLASHRARKFRIPRASSLNSNLHDE